jgi:hypothetical protein
LRDYVQSGNTLFDTDYFTSTSLENQAICEYEAYQIIDAYLNQRIKQLKSVPENSEQAYHSGIDWTLPKAHAVELAYALFYAKAFNNGQVKLNQIISAFETAFNIPLKNFHRTFIDVKNRTRNELFTAQLAQIITTQIQLDLK